MAGDYSPQQAYGLGGGLLGGGLAGLFGGGGKDPTKEAMGYFNNMPGILQQYYNPYIQMGNQMGQGLAGQYGGLMNDPAAMLNKIGGGYKQSPGFQFAMDQAMQGAGHGAAAGGMAGSPQHQQQNMQMASDIASQDYDRWMANALGLYGTGLGGAQSMYNTGAQAGMGLGTNLADIEAQKAKMAYESAKAKNENRGGLLGAFGTGLGALAGTYFGMPGVGAAIGGGIGKGIGG